MSDTPPPNVSVERRGGSIVAVKAEVPVERVEQAAERAFRRLVQKVSIPGFRPGKAPRALYERTYGPNHIYEEAARDLVDAVYRKAVDDERLNPLDSPDVSITQLGPNQALVFEATVPVRPHVELGDYRAHGAELAPRSVTDQEVEQVIAGMREQHAEIRPVERPAQTGDVLTVDVDVVLDGRQLPPLGRGAHIEIGGEYAIGGLSEGLVGARAGETKTLELAFPEDHPDPDVRGKKGAFAVAVDQVAEKVLPPLDDEFAKTVGVDSLASLKQSVRDELAHGAFHEARDEAADKALSSAVDAATVDVPELLVDQELDHMVADLRGRLEEQGLGFEQFLLRAKKTEEQIRAEWRDTARRRATSLLVLDEIARREEIGVTTEELAQQVALMPQDPKDPGRYASPRVLAALARSLRNRKVVDRLLGLDGPDAEREMLRRAGASVPEEEPAAPVTVAETGRSKE